MDGQMMHLFRGMFTIDLTNPRELKYWSVKFGVTMDQLAEAGKQATNQSVNGLRLALANRGDIRFQLPAD
jgi:predicted Zn-dependent protease